MTPLERAFREERAQVVAAVARRTGDLQLAEDAVSEAFVAAAATWPASGVPDRPGAWLTTTAWRRALDVLRRERAVPGPVPELESPEPATGEDDVLQLVLACCHPALSLEARVALTLRHVGGLTTREIAAAFLVPEDTMAKRLVRARGKVRDSGIRFEVPEHLDDRLASVHAVLYLVFTEGYLASGDGPAVRRELCEEAVWLTRQVLRRLPGEPETTGLLALMLLQHARSAARVDDERLVPFAEQDRSRWDGAAVEEARALLATTGAGPVGPYQVQAAIAALHAVDGEVSWPRVADLYALLDRLAPSPVVTVNRAVAVGRADGPNAGLAVLAPVLDDPRLARYVPLHAARADLLERGGDVDAAVLAWQHAAELAPSPVQRRELEARAAALAR